MEEKNMEEQEKDNRRYFYGTDGETKYYIEPPTAENVRGADWQYSKTYTMCLVEGITTSAEMVDILNRRGIIGPEFEQRANELAQKLSTAIAKLESSIDVNEKRELSIAVARAREELFQWNQRLNGPMNNTAEQMSDDARLEYLTSAMILDAKGDRVWNSYDTYLKEKSQSLALRARFEVMLYLQGLDSDFLEQTPEARAMKEVESDIMEKAQELIKASEAVLAEEAEIEEMVEENSEDSEDDKAVEKQTSKKKVTRKKKED